MGGPLLVAGLPPPLKSGPATAVLVIYLLTHLLSKRKWLDDAGGCDVVTQQVQLVPVVQFVDHVTRALANRVRRLSAVEAAQRQHAVRMRRRVDADRRPAGARR